MTATTAAYLGTPIPDRIAAGWRSWAAAEWRANQHRAANNQFPPDQRYTVRRPDGMCPAHRQHWTDYRDMRFDPVTGNRWPGYDGSPFEYHGHDMERLREERRVEWDQKATEQMRFIERICLSGSSPQCDRPAVVEEFVVPQQLALDVDLTPAA